MFADAALTALRAAVVVLGWRPAEFWAATPEELAAALAAVAGEVRGDPPLGRGELVRLLGEDAHGG